MRSVVLIVLLVGFCPAAGAAPTLRDLCRSAPLIVLASPTDPVTPLRFRPTALLRGSLPATAQLVPTNLDADKVRSFKPLGPAGGKPQPHHIQSALLFLERDGEGWKVLTEGLRFCTDQGITLQWSDRVKGMTPAAEVRWPVLISQVRADLLALDRLEAARRLPRPERRVEALLAWIASHRDDFRAVSTGSDVAPTGWGRLQFDIFDWIFASATPSQAWQAVNLFAELNNAELPRNVGPAFTSRAGRDLLFQIVSDSKRLQGERLRALQLLSRSDVLSGATEPITKEEQIQGLDRLTTLLEVGSEEFRVQVVRALVTLSQVEGLADPRAVPALMRHYKDSRKELLRGELALALAQLASAAQWKALSDNPPGVVAVLRDVERADSRLTFWVDARLGGASLHEAPQLVIERLGALGFVSETRRVVPVALNLPGGWSAGWKADVPLLLQADLGKLEPGVQYRVYLVGVVGKDRLAWKSEVARFNVPAQPNSDPTNRRSGFIRSR